MRGPDEPLGREAIDEYNQWAASELDRLKAELKGVDEIVVSLRGELYERGVKLDSVRRECDSLRVELMRANDGKDERERLIDSYKRVIETTSKTSIITPGSKVHFGPGDELEGEVQQVKISVGGVVVYVVSYWSGNTLVTVKLPPKGVKTDLPLPLHSIGADDMGDNVTWR